jgi:hypothetical protein
MRPHARPGNASVKSVKSLLTRPFLMHPQRVFEKLAGLRAELADLAFVLEGRGRRDAADVAMAIRARVGELYDDLAAASLTPHRDLPD